jgi:hypothetical protein
MLVVFAAFLAFLTGYLNPITVIVFSLVALGLLYGLAFWSVLTNTAEMPKVFDRNA